MTHFPVNCVRQQRERAGFSLEELATLVGQGSPSSIGHYEAGDRVPTFACALALGLILGIPLQDLFQQFYLSIEEDVVARANTLYESLDGASDPVSLAKRTALEAIPKRAVGTPTLV